MKPEPTLIEVGKPYYLDGGGPSEGMRYDVRGGQHCLDLVVDRLSSADIAAFRMAPVPFELGIVRGPLLEPVIIFLLFEMPGFLEWSDCPFSIHRVDPRVRVLPPTAAELGLQDEPHALLHMTLVSSEDGIVRALRALTFSPRFTMLLHGAIRDQLAAPWPGMAAYRRAIDEVYKKYPSTPAMRDDPDFIVARCRGGD